jgi:hypothetical protein
MANSVLFTSQFLPEPPLTRPERLRRVIRLCTSFTRNLAFHRAGMAKEFQTTLLHPRHPQAAFWMEAHSNCFDMCVLEWCKLFDPQKEKHRWKNIVSDPRAFEAGMLAYVGAKADEFAAHIKKMKYYCNKFVAHLDSDRKMELPFFDISYKAVEFYHEHVVTKEASPGDLHDVADKGWKLAKGYQLCMEEAESVYRHALTYHTE